MERKHVCVLYGGRSLERDVSLMTGRRVIRALKNLDYQVSEIDVDESLVRRMVDLMPEAVFIALHGRGGEDGTVQELLEILGIPYTGPRVPASIKAWDKVLTKHIFVEANIPTPDFYAFNDAAFRDLGAKDTLDIIAEHLGLPVVVKPSAQGSALGINFANEARDLPRAMMSALSFDRKVLLEKCIVGRELAVSVLDGDNGPEALPVVEAKPRDDYSYYDFDSRYVMGATDFTAPADLTDEQQAIVISTSLAAYEALGCTGFGRVDIIMDVDNTPWVLEVNTIPGLTETSLMPQAAEAAGLTFVDLVERMMRTALC
ncbi:MAG: D-alanine--D-alanine ligase [Actinobacteria bacterium]|nr:D-alanine--D-alanine ligase [Actinomycetota bacterium]